MITQSRKAKPKVIAQSISLALYNIRSAHNVGAIFRTADAIGVSKVYLCGYTPTPVDRFGRVRQDIAKAALGSEKSMTWEYIKNINTLLLKMKKEGFTILALEQDKKSLNYKKVKSKIKKNPKSLLILGNEIDGIPKKILNKSDYIIEIPMKGQKESLNVSVAAGIALFGLFTL